MSMPVVAPADIDTDVPPAPETPTLFQVRAALPGTLRDTVHSGRQLISEENPLTARAPLPTTVTAIDRLIAGGLPRGRLVEVTGNRSSGRFSALLATISATTCTGETAALVDLDDNFDPYSAQAAGVDLERLLWIRPSTIKEAMISAELVLQAGFPLVALDLGTPPVHGGRGSEGHWLRLARAADCHQSALFVSSPYRVSSTAATVVLTAERTRPIWYRNGRSPQMLDGLDGRFTLKKSRLASKSGDTIFHFTTAQSQSLVPSRQQREQSVAVPNVPGLSTAAV